MQSQPPRTSWRPRELSYEFLRRVYARFHGDPVEQPPNQALREGRHVYCCMEQASEFIADADIIIHVSEAIPHLGVCWSEFDGRAWTEAEIDAYLHDGEMPREYWGKDVEGPKVLFVGERALGDREQLYPMIRWLKTP